MIKSFLNRIIGGSAKEHKADRVVISLKSRDSFLYKEGNHKMELSAEILVGQNVEREIWVLSDERWLPPFEDEKLTDVDKERIFKNFCNHLDKAGIKYRVRRME